MHRTTRMLFSALTALSLALAVVFAAFWLLAAFGVFSERQYINLGDARYVCIDARDLDVRFAFSSEPADGPFRSQLFGFASNPEPKVSGFDWPGIYTREARWRSGVVYWKYAISALYPLALTLVFPIARVANQLLRRRATRLGRCATCGYDLRASTERCPECGEIAANARPVA